MMRSADADTTHRLNVCVICPWKCEGSCRGAFTLGVPTSLAGAHALGHARPPRRHLCNNREVMPPKAILGGVELLVLLALIRLGDEAYGVPISDEIEANSGRSVSVGSVYIALDRLERKGLVSSRLGEATAERGGRAKTYFRPTAKGLREVRLARLTLIRLWQGVPQLEGGTR